MRTGRGRRTNWESKRPDTGATHATVNARPRPHVSINDAATSNRRGPSLTDDQPMPIWAVCVGAAGDVRLRVRCALPSVNASGIRAVDVHSVAASR